MNTLQSSTELNWFADLPECAETSGISFAEAVERSHRQHDTPEQQAARYEIAMQLQAAMQPGASVIHQATRLDVRGGILLGTPNVAEIGRDGNLAISFSLWRNNGDQLCFMRFRDLVYGTHFGAEHHPPALAVGPEGIKEYMRGQSIMFDDVANCLANTESYTCLRAYGALSETDLRLSDMRTDTGVQIVQNELVARLDDPAYCYMWPQLERALMGTAHTSNA
jgi:hypothetical protein